MLLALALVGAAGCASGPVSAKGDGLPLPALTGRVVDQASLLDPAAEAALTAKLAALEADTTDQLVVVTLPDLKGEPIEATARRLGIVWGIGRNKTDNGVVLLVAASERKVRIEVGDGLVGLLTDERAAEIVGVMVLRFRDGKFEDGIVLGVDEISKRLRSDRRRPQRLEPLKAAA